MYTFLSKIQENVYLSRDKDFVFLTSSRISIAVDADPFVFAVSAGASLANGGAVRIAAGKGGTAGGAMSIAAGAGTGISAKFIEKGGADLIIIYNSGRFRMAGHGSTAGLMAYGDANAVAMEIGEYEVLPVVQEVPVICGVHATDPRRRMWHWLLQVKDMGFSGVNNFPTHSIVDGKFRQILEETGMSVQKEVEMVGLARKMDMFSIVYVGSTEEAKGMAEVGADAIIAHVGTTIGGSIGVFRQFLNILRRTTTVNQEINIGLSLSTGALEAGTYLKRSI